MAQLTMEQYHRFFNPGTVAIIGASEKTGPGSYNLMENLIKDGSTARVFPVNIRATEVLGQKAYKTILEVPEKVDQAVITLPRQAVVQAVADCVAKGVRNIIVISQGFADADDQGRAWQKEMEKLIAGTGVRLIGPNSIGLANSFDKYHTSFQPFDLYPKANAMICQSGMFVLASADFTTGLGLGVDIGNGADVRFNELLACMGQDERIKVINLHLEGLTEGREFLKTAAEISRVKPILAYKVGRSEEAAQAAASHSGSLAGEDHVFEAAFERAGIMRVSGLEEMNDLNKALLTYPGIKGRRVAVVTLSGGGGIAVVDALAEEGLEMARPGQETMARLQAMNPDWLIASNPVDTWMATLKKGLAGATAEILELLLTDENVDAAVVLLNCYRTTGLESLRELVDRTAGIAQARPDKPVLLWAFGANQGEVIDYAEKAGPLAGFTSPERAARALAGLHRFDHRIRGRKAERPKRPAGLDQNRAAAVLGPEREEKRILGSEVLEALAAYGIETARGGFAAGPQEALELAERIGYPLVLKVVSEQVVHKSDSGGVRLGVGSSRELEEAYGSILTSVKAKVPQARIQGMFVQPFLSGGVEVIIGGKRDPQFGPVLLFGLGGIYTEILADLAFGLAPLSKSQARTMIESIRSAPILKGARGGVAADLDRLAETITKVGWLMEDFPTMAELDLNPLSVGVDRVVALDARAVMGGEPGSGPKGLT